MVVALPCGDIVRAENDQPGRLLDTFVPYPVRPEEQILQKTNQASNSRGAERYRLSTASHSSGMDRLRAIYSQRCCAARDAFACLMHLLTQAQTDSASE